MKILQKIVKERERKEKEKEEKKRKEQADELRKKLEPQVRHDTQLTVD